MSAGRAGAPAEPYDCIVIGAGPAGPSASLFLARYRRRVLTFQHNGPRNIYSQGVHGFLGHHGIPPAELLAHTQVSRAGVAARLPPGRDGGVN